ncbi:MAG: ATP-binding protein [Desulfobacteraceae bacterium]|nr:ATP-binding protein [Desulfobacteraceae bacterium]
MKLTSDPAIVISDRRLAEINYHYKFNIGLVIAWVPAFIFFAIYYYLRANYLQAGLFAALSLNAVVTLYLAYKISDRLRLVLLKQIGGVIAFGLLAGSLLAGILSNEFYGVLPWIFGYPVVVVLFFGERIGIACSVIFCTAAAVSIYFVELPPWTASAIQSLKNQSIAALVLLLISVLISERTRVRMRNSLINARNKYKTAEEQQRLTNEELKREIEMRLQSEKALIRSESRYRAIFEESTVSLWEEDYSRVKRYLDELPQEASDDLEGYFTTHPDEVQKCLRMVWVTAVNRATLDLYEADSKSTLLKHIWDILPADLNKYLTGRLLSLYRNSRFEAQVDAQTLSGRKLHLLLGSTVPAGYEDSWAKVFTSVYDITGRVAVEEEKKLVERQLQHTRQIQAIASLAGGIAHQFNNALAVIWGSLDLLERSVPKTDKTGRYVGSLRSSSEHMRHLTEQLLAYARGGKYKPMDFSVNKLIMEILKSSKISRDRAYKISLKLEDNVTLAGSDITQIRIVLEAVLANAAEAMAGGGEIAISASRIVIQEDPQGLSRAVAPGNYAQITIEDRGSGMDDDTRQRIFEPFFTTKFVGRGLGMAAAYGIVRSHGGMIEVASEPGQGTRVMVYLPAAATPSEAIMADNPVAPGAKTVLAPSKTLEASISQ